ncbi:hypothetical protein B0J12DRAFT_725021 [Macrophomina phaseolina]|uniref:Uncharacterized protein n=1 Tax=Macrophomina phaseolina TaxID=35725 RepID=A0ABQ8GNX9_9PEZI|nr:hypothetical protein B0J12DRAFT_725021 [Macrophomina phaseolina]
MLIVETQPIFSVTATEKSFVLGVLRLQKRGFVQMLVRKTIGHLLPTDLTVIIEDDLFENYWARTAKTWERTDGLWKEGHPGLYWERYMTEDALRAWCKLADTLNLTLAAREGPHAKYLSSGRSAPDTPRSTPYIVHLARAGAYSHGALALAPSSALHLPSSSSATDSDATDHHQRDSDSLRLARLRSGVCGTSVDCVKGVACATFVASREGEFMEGSDRVERFLEVEGLEEEVRGWDTEAVRKRECAGLPASFDTVAQMGIRV